MARRKAEKIDVGQEKPERKKRESMPVTIYAVTQIGVDFTLRPLQTPHADLASAMKRIRSEQPGEYAIGRLQFVSVEEQTVKKTVLVKK